MTAKRTRAALAIVTAMISALGTEAANAQSKGEGRAAIVQELLDCRKMTDITARLACYDQSAAALDQAESKGDVVVIDREQARKVRKQAFGFTLPSISIFAKGETQEALDASDGVVASARRNGDGRWVVKLEDGAIWTQVDSETVARSPKAGMTIKIRKAAMGSYLMNVDGQRAFRARRVE